MLRLFAALFEVAKLLAPIVGGVLVVVAVFWWWPGMLVAGLILIPLGWLLNRRADTIRREHHW